MMVLFELVFFLLEVASSECTDCEFWLFVVHLGSCHHVVNPRSSVNEFIVRFFNILNFGVFAENSAAHQCVAYNQ